MTEHNIRLNPNCASVVNTGLKFKSGDKGIIFVIAVDELDTTDTTAKIVFQRANGTSVESDITGTAGVYRYKTLGNEFAVPGKTVADVKFYTSEERVSTASFVFEVCGDTMAGLGAGTGGYSDRLEQLVKEAEEAGELTEQAKAELEAAENDMKKTEAEMAAVLQNFKKQYEEFGTLNPRGNWNSTTNYQIRDVVYRNSSTWICLADNIGVEPSDANGAFWMRSTDLECIINGTTPVGNALKLNGLGAEEFVRGVSPYFTEGETILEWANNPNGVYEKIITNTYSFPSDIPVSAEGFCKLSYDAQGRKKVIFTMFNGNSPTVQYARSIFSGQWLNEWKSTADGGNADTVDGYHASDFVTKGVRIGKLDFNDTDLLTVLIDGSAQSVPFGVKGHEIARKADVLPLTGGTLSGQNLFINSGTGLLRADGNQTQLRAYSTAKDDNNCRALSVISKAYTDNVNNAVTLHDVINGVLTNYTVLHTGNSQKVSTGTTAPTDTTTMWYDTANNTWKRYVDGAWTIA